MIKYIIIAVLIFDIGFVIGSGYGHLRREEELLNEHTYMDKN